MKLCIACCELKFAAPPRVAHHPMLLLYREDLPSVAYKVLSRLNVFACLALSRFPVLAFFLCVFRTKILYASICVVSLTLSRH